MISIAREATQTRMLKPSFAGIKPPHPGMVFKFKHVDCTGINATQMAKSLDVRWATMSETFCGKRRVSMAMAAKFAEYTGETILYWYQMQINRDVWEYERELLKGEQ